MEGNKGEDSDSKGKLTLFVVVVVVVCLFVSFAWRMWSLIFMLTKGET